MVTRSIAIHVFNAKYFVFLNADVYTTLSHFSELADKNDVHELNLLQCGRYYLDYIGKTRGKLKFVNIK